MRHLDSEYSVQGINFSFLKPILTIIVDVAKEMDFNFMVIGATARDFLIKSVFQTDLVLRATLDLDFAIILDDWKKYDQILEELIKKHGFVKAKAKQRLHYNSIPVDIIPFGEISEGESIFWPPDKSIKMSVTGFQEVFDSAVHIKFDDLNFRILSLEGLFITKLIAWSDRKLIKKTDAEDIGSILYNYHDFYPDELFEDYNYLIDSEGYNYLLAGVSIFSIRLKIFLKQYPDLLLEILAILQGEIKDEENSELAIELNKTESYEINLQALKIIEEELSKS